MDLENILSNTGIIGIISALSPFVLPFFYEVLQKIFEREITKEEKRLVNTVLAMTISAVVLLVSYDWVGDWKQDLLGIAQFFLINFAIIKGIIQTIYETLVKGIEPVDTALTKITAMK